MIESRKLVRDRSERPDRRVKPRAALLRAADELFFLDGEHLARLDVQSLHRALASVGELEPRVVSASRHALDLQPLVVIDRAIGIVRGLVGAEGRTCRRARARATSPLTTSGSRIECLSPSRVPRARSRGRQAELRVSSFLPGDCLGPCARARCLMIMALRDRPRNACYAARLIGSRRLNSSAPSSIAPNRKAMTSRA